MITRMLCLWFNKPKKTEIPGITVEVPPPVPKKIIEKKVIRLIVTCKNNIVLNYSSRTDKDKNVSYIDVFYDFYKWYFMRLQSEVYMFVYSTGATSVLRKEILQVKFIYEYESEEITEDIL